ncbi:MAG: energy-coupling factor transporter transmembrane protein EcfT [Clostridia bacterium]|nr:energy-coupling factor transporter transmembrane protein EcfT [Clostridia bacterium]MBR1685858.1 energy-coupling factor transporter transmembrane protein EcfT [Clostridia bacterium]MBR2287834.1 energy-coupling factor transporter transmembrane protein EcfT [Clostridia bacterium]
MFSQFHARHPLYPLIALACSLLSLLVGMVCAQTPYIFAYILFLDVLFLAFGMGMATLMMNLGMGVFGIVAGAITALINRTFDMFWITPARCLLIGVCVVPLLAVPPAMLTRSLNQLHCPRLITLGMLITVRFIPVVFGEMRQIKDAMRSRGIDTRWYSPAWYRPSNLYRAFLVPLVMRMVGISDTLSLSVESRAFDPQRRDATVYHSVHPTARDWTFATLVLLAMAALILERFVWDLPFPEVKL